MEKILFRAAATTRGESNASPLKVQFARLRWNQIAQRNAVTAVQDFGDFGEAFVAFVDAGSEKITLSPCLIRVSRREPSSAKSQ